MQINSDSQASDRLLTVNDVQRVLRLGRTKIWKLRRAGKLPTVYIERSPRFRLSDVEEILQSGVPE